MGPSVCVGVHTHCQETNKKTVRMRQSSVLHLDSSTVETRL